VPRIKPAGPNSLASASKDGGGVPSPSPNTRSVLAAAVVVPVVVVEVAGLSGPCCRLRSESRESPGWLTRDDTCVRYMKRKENGTTMNLTAKNNKLNTRKTACISNTRNRSTIF